MLTVTNVRRITKDDEKMPRLVDLDPVTKTAAARRRLALHLSTLTIKPPLVHGKDGKTWDRLVSQYGESEVMTIIETCVREKHVVLTGIYFDSNITPSTVEFYAKTFYKSVTLANEENYVLIKHAHDADGSWNDGILREAIVMYRLQRSDMPDSVDIATIERVFA